MSVIVRDRADRIILYCKGADSSILPVISEKFVTIQFIISDPIQNGAINPKKYCLEIKHPFYTKRSKMSLNGKQTLLLKLTNV